ncbi:MAG TPA: hypothetical protein VGS11_07425 [Candidatus Bathyarchaeia archaeon]|nr:hypothetical protein [Candidatus Bathyarchaeia archaeon]
MLSESGYLAAHEKEVIRILRVLNDATDGFVVIGGYAVNAYGHHRYSVECELATNRDDLPVIDTTLLGEGYELWKDRLRPPIGVTTREYRKTVGEPVSLEFSVNNVVSSTTRGTWTYKFMRENSAEVIVAGATGSTPSRVAQRNLLVAMKLHAGRTQDFADVVVLSEKVDWKTVARCAACGAKEKLLEQIDSAIREISSARFVSDLKSAFAMRSDPTLLVKEANHGLHSVRTLIAEQKFRDFL